MTHEEYLLINEKGFEGDGFLKAEIEKIVKEKSINLIIETGTFRGNTTKKFSEMCDTVITIEVNKEFYEIACLSFNDYLKDYCNFNSSVLELFYSKELSERRHSYFQSGTRHITAFNMSSEKWLYENIARCSHNTLFFLDAHWNDYCPLRDELATIRDAKIKPSIIIHDFKVPGRPDLGYDTYKGQDYCFEWIEDLLKEIYGDELNYRYNTQAEGANRGVIFINC